MFHNLFGKKKGQLLSQKVRDDNRRIEQANDQALQKQKQAAVAQIRDEVQHATEFLSNAEEQLSEARSQINREDWGSVLSSYSFCKSNIENSKNVIEWINNAKSQLKDSEINFTKSLIARDQANRAKVDQLDQSAKQFVVELNTQIRERKCSMGKERADYFAEEEKQFTPAAPPVAAMKMAQ